jgi:8-amino-7-oxononanoate synthase
MNDSRAIAIIGMSCMFPGSPDIESFWRTICDGRAHFRDVPADRWDHSIFHNPNPRAPDTTYARKIAYLDDIRMFAPERYGIPPRRAVLMDPQQRLMLDQARLAIDDAGYGGRGLPRSTGVYIGATLSEYRDLAVARLRAKQVLNGQWGDVPELDEAAARAAAEDVMAMRQYSMVGILLNMIACGVSEAFDLQGPALAMDAACSSSLMALHEAMLHLRERICDAAIVGGVYSICSPDMMVAFGKIGALSKSDMCRPFDDGADGFVVGEGAGAIVLKRLDDALRDRDRIWAVVRGVGLNNDGRGDGPMTPRLGGQADALARAYRDAGVSLDTVGYVEAHGTATLVGDLTEISALKENAKGYAQGRVDCAVASVKGNIGHTLAAAGMAGIIKAALVLDRRLIPPQAGLRTPREALGLEGSGFYLPTSALPFDGKPGLPRRVGVSAFGFGGTNVHVVLEEPPQPIRQSITTHAAEAEMPQLFIVSAATPPLLAQYLSTLADAVELSTASLRDLAYTLTATRRRESKRVAFVVSNKRELREKLLSASLTGETSDAIARYSTPRRESRRDAEIADWKQQSNGDFANAVCALQARGKRSLLNGAMDSFLVENVDKSTQILSLLETEEDSTSGLLKAIGRLAIMGVPLNLASLYGDAKPVSLPSAPLQTREFWVVDDKKRSEKNVRLAEANGVDATAAQSVGDIATLVGTDEREAPAEEITDHSPQFADDFQPGKAQGMEAVGANSEVGFAAPAADASPADPGETAAQLLPRIIELIAKVSAYPLEELTPEQRLGADLGFDSLMGVDLYVALTEIFPEAGDLPQTMIGGETTIEELVRSIAALTVRPGEVMPDAGLSEESVTDRVFIRFSADEYPWLEDHRIEGKLVIPFAFLLEQAAAAAGRLGLGSAVSLSNAQLLAEATVPVTGTDLEVVANASRSRGEIEINLIGENSSVALMRVSAAGASTNLPPLALPDGGKAPELPLSEFYRERTFHGPRFHVLGSIMEIGAAHAIGLLDARAAGGVGGTAFDILSLDAMLQLAAYWSSATNGRIGLPISAGEVRVLGRQQANAPTNAPARVAGILEDSSGDLLTGSFDLIDSEGFPLIQIRELRCRLMSRSSVFVKDRHDSALSENVDPANWQIESFPEVRALRERIETFRNSGFIDPYFSVHERVTNDTSVIGGREYVNFASYNYLGLSGDAEVTAAAIEALRRYGTSVSASRLASGEKPLHRELEREIAEFLGCEDAIVMVGGHATNVSVIGHLFGPQDLVIHDSLAHDSILAGIKLAGARRRPFPHNDLNALNEILRQSRSTARRVLIAIEGVYSMDGDVPPLEAIVEIKRRHHALLLVDEAHSLGVLGNTGRGIGEHCNVKREDVDLWMGTLSKSLASCGGYIAGSAELVRYLKYSNPGFIYSVGISPANAAAALAALRKLRAHPELVATLRDRSRLFCSLSQKHGIDTGLSNGTAVVPCIVGNSQKCLLLAHALGEKRINVQPILYPAVEESLTRLRFFVTARHSEQQIGATVTAVAESLERINPHALKDRSPKGVPRRIDTLQGGLRNAAVS